MRTEKREDRHSTQSNDKEKSRESEEDDHEEDSEENYEDLVSVFVQVGRCELPVYAPKTSTIAQLKEFVEDTFWLIDGLTVPGPSSRCRYHTEAGESVLDTQTLADFVADLAKLVVFVVTKPDRKRSCGFFTKDPRECRSTY